MSRADFHPYQQGLPEDLQKEINRVRTPLCQMLLGLLDEAGGTLNVSELLVGLWKRHKIIRTRQFVVSKMYRMRLRGLVRSTGRKGEYTVEGRNDR